MATRHKIKSHRDLVFALGGPSELARRLGIWRPSPPTLHWPSRGIPARYWPRVSLLAYKYGIVVTAEQIERMPVVVAEREPA